MPYGGTFIYERIRELREQGIVCHTNVVVNNYSKLVRILYKIIKKSNIDTEPIEWASPSNVHIILIPISLFQIMLMVFGHDRIYQVFSTRKLRRILERDLIEHHKKGRIIHSHYYYPLGYCLAQITQKYNMPCIITSHDSIAFSKIDLLAPKRRQMVYDTMSKADRIIYVTRANMLDAVSRGASVKNGCVINNGINPNMFYPLTFEEACSRTGYIPTKKYVVGFVGTLSRVKRADKFPEIFQHIASTISDVEFILVGGGDVKIIESIVSSGVKVKLVGPVQPNELVNWMNLFNVLILPSRQESWGCVVREAYACGVPVIGSDVEGLPEALGDAGISINSNYNDFERKFAKCVCKVLSGDVGISRGKLLMISSRSGWDKCVENEIQEYVKLYEKY